MSTINKREQKGVYVSPVIEKVLLDNEISLALESDPAVGPGEGVQGSLAPEYFQPDPFKDGMA